MSGVWNLGQSWKDKIVLLYLFFILRIMHALNRSSLRKPRKVVLSFGGVHFSAIIEEISDIWVLEEIFASEEYKLPFSDIKSILDLGANTGMSACYFQSQYPDAKIFAFEPNPKVFDKMVDNVSSIKTIVPIQKAIYTKPDQLLEIFLRPGSHLGTSLFATGEGIKVETETLDNFMAKNSLTVVDLIKFDIEGLEYDVFQQFKGLGSVKYLIGEVHLDHFKKPLSDFLALFSDFEVVFQKGSKKRVTVALKNKNLAA